MVKDYSNRNYSTLIAGILVISTIVAIFLVFTTGVIILRNSSENDIRLMENGGFYLSDKKDSENAKNDNQGFDNLVSGSEKGPVDTNLPVEAGSISYSFGILDPSYELPLCITSQADVDELNSAICIKVTSKGGYFPESGIAYVMQSDRLWYDPQVSKGKLGLVFTELTKPEGACCSTFEYCVSFEYIEDICLVSTQNPDTLPPGWNLFGAAWCTEKLVDFCFEIDWIGCWFTTIPASDLQSP